jgi:hypothetical protein
LFFWLMLLLHEGALAEIMKSILKIYCRLLCYFFELLRIRMTELRCYDSLGYQLVLIGFHSS